MWTTTRATLAALISCLPGIGLAGGGTASNCTADVFEEVPYTYCIVDPARDRLRFWHTAPDGLVYGTFDRLNTVLAGAGLTLGFAMNGGMYHDDRAPVGLYIEEGETLVGITTRAGPGNFGLLPNGVFCLTGNRARVIESRTFAAAPPPCDYASQSGPLMVEAGRLHPEFLPGGSSRYIRNGVGVRPNGTVVFAISDRPVNFHRFARIFRDALGTPDALYIDGSVSRLYAPSLGRHDVGFPLGPIVGTAVPLDRADKH